MRLSRLTLLFVLAAAVAVVVVPGASALTFPDELCPVATGTVIKVCPDGETGKSYSLQIKGREGTGCVPYVTFRNIGALPTGLTMSSSGLISGTPTQAGEWTFWIEMKDVPSWEGGISWCGDDHSTEKQFRITIVPGLQIVQRESRLTPGQLNTPYNLPFSATGGTPTWSVSSGSLPGGLRLDSSTGLLSGTPTATGDYTFKVTATAGSRSDTQTYTLSVVEQLRITKPAAAAEVGLPFELKLTAAGGRAPYKWSATGLSSGFTLNADTGVISGVPGIAGSTVVNVTVTDSLGLTTTVDVPLPVAARLGILRKALPLGTVGARYGARFTAVGGLRPFRWTVVAAGARRSAGLATRAGALPAGIKLNARTGQLSGTPRKAGTYKLQVQLTDKAGGQATRVFVLKVKASGARR